MLHMKITNPTEPTFVNAAVHTLQFRLGGELWLPRTVVSRGWYLGMLLVDNSPFHVLAALYLFDEALRVGHQRSGLRYQVRSDKLRISTKRQPQHLPHARQYIPLVFRQRTMCGLYRELIKN